MWPAEYYYFPISGSNFSLSEQISGNDSCLPQLRQANDKTSFTLSSTCWSQVQSIAVGQSIGARQKQAGTFPKSKERVKGIYNAKTREVWKVLYLLITQTSSFHFLYSNSEQKENGNSSSDSLPALFFHTSQQQPPRALNGLGEGSLVMSTSKGEVQQNLVCALIYRCQD